MIGCKFDYLKLANFMIKVFSIKLWQWEFWQHMYIYIYTCVCMCAHMCAYAVNLIVPFYWCIEGCVYVEFCNFKIFTGQATLLEQLHV